MCPLLAILTAEQPQPPMRPPGPTSAPRTKALHATGLPVLRALRRVNVLAFFLPTRYFVLGLTGKRVVAQAKRREWRFPMFDESGFWKNQPLAAKGSLRT